MEKKRFFTARNIACLAVLVALIVVLQLWGGYIRIAGTSLSFVLVPIVLGAILLGRGAGAFLGLLFGVITIAMGITSDPFTQYLFGANPVGTILICLLKGLAAGLIPGLLYAWIARKNGYLGAIVASLAAPVCNTGIFVIGCLLMSGTLEGYMGMIGGYEGMSVAYFVIVVVALVNFIVEFVISAVLSPAIYAIVRVVGRAQSRRKPSAPAAAAEECPEEGDAAQKKAGEPGQKSVLQEK